MKTFFLVIISKTLSGWAPKICDLFKISLHREKNAVRENIISLCLQMTDLLTIFQWPLVIISNMGNVGEHVGSQQHEKTCSPISLLKTF
jgi:hypothetical protein